MAPNLTEILFLIGMDSSVVGVTDYCDFPAAARSKPKIGGMLNPNIERVLALQPDLVLMTGSGNMKSDYDRLTASGVHVFVSYPTSVNGVFKSISDIGALTERQKIADSIVAALRIRRDSLVAQCAGTTRRTVLMLVSLNPLIAIGPRAFLNELVQLANGENIIHDSSTAYPVLSREEILRRQPDVIVATNDIVRSVSDMLSPYPEWSKLTAVRGRHVAIVDASVVTRPGPRIIDGLAVMMLAIHGNR
jgi:iron complex transport system substrate-binding protein